MHSQLKKMNKKITAPAWLAMVVSLLAAIISGVSGWMIHTREDVKKAQIAAAQKQVDYGRQIEIVDRFSNGYDWLVPYFGHLDSISDGYAIIFIPNKEEYISGKICEAIGYTRSELGRTIDDLKKHVNPQDFATFARACGQIIENRRGSFKGMKRFRTKQGGEIVYDVRVTKEGPYLISVFNRVADTYKVAAK